MTDAPFFSRALMLCFALFYVLNLEYCKPLKEVCQFLQEFVFSLPSVGSRQKSATYLSVTDIQKFSSSACKFIWKFELSLY